MDDVIINKTAIIDRCIKRMREMYIGYETEFDVDYMRQDAVILNLQRACVATIDLGLHIVKIKELGVPKSIHDVFEILKLHHIFSEMLCNNLQSMAGLCNATFLDPLKVHSILENRLNDLEQLVKLSRQLVRGSPGFFDVGPVDVGVFEAGDDGVGRGKGNDEK